MMKTDNRKINFGAGPATLPIEVLQLAANAVLDFDGRGISILELPHRGKEFNAIIEESKLIVRELCQLDDNYEVLWLQGGGRQQFCMVPMNFLDQNGTAGYVDSGHWSSEAMKYAGHYGNAAVIASSKNTGYNRLPNLPDVLPKGLAYIHFTTNNTIYGTQLQDIPLSGSPLVADMSSDIFSCNRDHSKYDLFYAAAQKNIGIAGIGLVVLRREMLEKQVRTLPPMFDYKENVRENSVLNTANVFGIYTSLLMLRWIKSKGIDNIEKENIAKAALLYNAIDNNSSFLPYVNEKSHRSNMNVCFNARNIEIENRFLQLCREQNITGVKGHRLVGGFRVSLYNAITLDSVKILTQIINSIS